MILSTRSGAGEAPAPTYTRLSTLVRYRQTWGVVLTKAILDPYWFLVADWFALFLESRGFKLEETLVGFWVPFVCADIGNFVGGGLSGYFIHRGWSVGAARRVIFLICGPLMLLMIPAAYTTQLWLLIAEFGLATLGYAACATIFLTLPSDLFESGSVATVSGFAGMVTGFVTIAATLYHRDGHRSGFLQAHPTGGERGTGTGGDRRVHARAEHAEHGERRAAEDLRSIPVRGDPGSATRLLRGGCRDGFRRALNEGFEPFPVSLQVGLFHLDRAGVIGQHLEEHPSEGSHASFAVGGSHEVDPLEGIVPQVVELLGPMPSRM